MNRNEVTVITAAMMLFCILVIYILLFTGQMESEKLKCISSAQTIEIAKECGKCSHQ